MGIKLLFSNTDDNDSCKKTQIENEAFLRKRQKSLKNKSINAYPHSNSKIELYDIVVPS